MQREGDCVCGPCDCELTSVSGGDGCICSDPPCDCGLPKDECACKPCECDEPKDLCVCDPCVCETPPASPNPPQTPQGDFCNTKSYPLGFNLNEFIRAKEYFLTASSKTGLNLYDHLAEVLRKMLDVRAPPNTVDFIEEISLNTKRYRFRMGKDLIRDAYFLSPPLVEDAMAVLENWKQHSNWEKMPDKEGTDESYGGFPNLMRLLYYLEYINVGLPREEMFRLALALRQFNFTTPIKRSRFWGKIFGIEKNYYVIEAELVGSKEENLWRPTQEEVAVEDAEPLLPMANENNFPDVNFISGAATFDRARSAVTDPDILAPYQKTSGLAPDQKNCIMPSMAAPISAEFMGEEAEAEGGLTETAFDQDAATEAGLWARYQQELMQGFPDSPKLAKTVPVPAEGDGQGVNRRAFYVANELSEKWLLLPFITPEQIQVSRKIRRHLTGKLESKLEAYPEFQGFEAHYLKTLLARVTAGTQVSPKGYYRRTKPVDDEEEEDEEEVVDEEEEEYDEPLPDVLYVTKKYHPPGAMLNLLSLPPDLWVHHVSHILKQGRTSWWNPNKQYDDEEIGEEEEEEEDEGSGREIGPRLFSSCVNDVSSEGFEPWSTRPSTTVFTEFQTASLRSNIWPGASAFCTYKGKVENIYFGDGMKFRGACFSPPVPKMSQNEYNEGPELTEVEDPDITHEQEWLNKVELEGLNDVEEKFVDNEEVSEIEEEELTDEEN